MRPHKRFRRIVWAVDPAEKPDRPLILQAKRIIEQFRRAGNIVIEPVHVLQMGEELALETAKWRGEYLMAAEDRMAEFLAKAGVSNLASPCVIFHDSLSIRSAVDALCQHAIRNQADLIIAQTHGRTGLSRLFLGSFAETLLQRSKLPVLLVNQHGRAAVDPRNLLFPMDFGPQANAQFNRVLELAEEWGSRITLFHSLEHLPNPALFASVERMPLIYAEYREDWLARVKRRSERWSELARARGLGMSVILDRGSQPAWEGIVRTARRIHAGLIVLQSHSGPVSAALLGSVARQVVRHADAPVWILKPERRAASREIPARRAA